MLKQMINDDDVDKSDEDKKQKKPVETNFLKSRSKFTKQSLPVGSEMITEEKLKKAASNLIG